MAHTRAGTPPVTQQVLPPPERIYNAPLPVKAPSFLGFFVWLAIWAVIAYLFYQPGLGFWNWYATFFWTLPTGVAAVGIYGFLKVSRPVIRSQTASDTAVHTDLPLTVVISSLATEGVIGALSRVVRSTKVLSQYFDNYQVIVLTDEGKCTALPTLEAIVAQLTNTRIIVVPKGYHSAGKAKFKARASHYELMEMRIKQRDMQIARFFGFDRITDNSRKLDLLRRIRDVMSQVNSSDHVLASDQLLASVGQIIDTRYYVLKDLHELMEKLLNAFVFRLDDDTAMGADTAREIARFMEANRGTRGKHLAQGILTYPKEFSANLLVWLADAIRSFDDVGRFAATTGTGTPMSGIHGECLLLREWVESRIGWDFGEKEIVEDSRFALVFATLFPGKSAWLAMRVYGASPVTVWEFLKQRRRWADGMTGLMLNRKVPFKRRALVTHNMIVWGAGIFQPAGVVFTVSWFFYNYNVSPVTVWVVPLWVFSSAYTYWAYWEGLKINARASGRKRPELLHMVLLVPGILLFSLWEGLGGTLGMAKYFYEALKKKEKSFDMVGKPS